MIDTKEFIIDLSKDFPEGEPFQLTEYVIGVTRKNWICGTDNIDEIQLVALFERIDFAELDNKFDDEEYTIAVTSSMMVHPKHFAQDYIKRFIDGYGYDSINGNYSVYDALQDAYAYGGGIQFDIESVKSLHKCDVDSIVKDYNNGIPYRWFKDWQDADRYIKEVYIPNVNAIMVMCGFALDRHTNRIGSTGWDFIENMTTGSDWLTPALERAKNHGNTDN